MRLHPVDQLRTVPCMRLVLMTVLLATTLAARQSGDISVRAAARAMQPGEVIRLTIDTSTPVETLGVSVFGTTFPAFPVDETNWQALIGVDLDVEPGVHTVSIVATHAGGVRSTTRTIEVKPKQFPTRRLTVEPRYVEPPPTVTDRIVREARQLNAIWAAHSPTRFWDGAFAAPVPDKPNSAFGSRSVFNNQPRSPHGGADFASPSGRVVRAPNAGRVVLAEDLYYTGGSVAIDHGLGLVSLFAHLSSIDATPGTTVKAGDAIGRVGATGRVTGPHLHWTVRLAGTRVDPLSLMNVTGLPDSTMSTGLLP